jgi:hypothetical protein
VLRERDVLAWTGLSSERWRELAAVFPELPRDPGPRAARARRRMAELAMRALSRGDWSPAWDGPEPPEGPAVYATAHLGSLLSLRYVLRARGIAAASVLAPYNFDRSDPAAKDALFDRHFPMPYPHVASSARTHRLRSLLGRGGLILAADLPAAESFPAGLLGGEVSLDPRPFRLARLSRVPCVPIFLTLRGRRWTVQAGERLPAGERAALDAFARALAEAASRAPLELDGPVYWKRYVSARRAS